VFFFRLCIAMVIRNKKQKQPLSLLYTSVGHTSVGPSRLDRPADVIRAGPVTSVGVSLISSSGP
jgi:hypothetical protein